MSLALPWHCLLPAEGLAEGQTQPNTETPWSKKKLIIILLFSQIRIVDLIMQDLPGDNDWEAIVIS